MSVDKLHVTSARGNRAGSQPTPSPAGSASRHPATSSAQSSNARKCCARMWSKVAKEEAPLNMVA